jgi:Spy/CpxP family protein refolding chaperone
MNKLPGIVAVAVILLLFPGSITFADHQALRPADHQPSHTESDQFLRHLITHAKEIGLSADQLVSVKALQLDFDLVRITVDAEIMLTEREIAAMFDNDKVEQPAVEAKIHQSEAMRATLRVASFKALRKAQALLTPEQQEKSRKILAVGRTKTDVSQLTHH